MSSELIVSAEERIRYYRELQKLGLICLDDDFMPSVHYPQITMYPPITQEKLFENYRHPEDGRFVIYAHIPFCKKCCTFCHYPNQYGNHRESEKDVYLSAMEKEMDLYMQVLGLDKIQARSILIGGGTPTFLTPAQLERFLRFFTARVDLSRCTQFNYDVDPQTIIGAEGKERLHLLKDHGVDRLTIGIQSLDDEILRKMNRHHSSEEAVESVQVAQDMGFQLNIEFIYGYPGQSLRSWISDMEKAVRLGVEEIQIYRLKIIPYGDKVGVITKKFAEDDTDFISIEDTIRMKHFSVMYFAENGYHENLRRVYTRKKKYYSHYAHDQCCELADTLGFGLTAFSSLHDRFGLNTQHLQEYYASIEQGRLPVNRGLVRNRDDQMRWNVILPLKNRDVPKAQFLKNLGVSLDEIFGAKIERLKRHGLVHEDDKKLELTTLGGFFADEVCQVFHHPNYMPFPESAYAPGELNPYNP